MAGRGVHRLKRRLGGVDYRGVGGLPEVSEFYHVDSSAAPAAASAVTPTVKVEAAAAAAAATATAAKPKPPPPRSVCWWDTEPFDGEGVSCPVHVRDARPGSRDGGVVYRMEGRFCSYGCAYAYGLEHADDSVRRQITQNIVALLLTLETDGFKTATERRAALRGDAPLPVKAAPPRVVLEKFGGPLSLARFRALLDDPTRFVSVSSSRTAQVVPVQFGVFIEDFSRPLVPPRHITRSYEDKREVLDEEEARQEMTGTRRRFVSEDALAADAANGTIPRVDAAAPLRERPSSTLARTVPAFQRAGIAKKQSGAEFLALMQQIDAARVPPGPAYRPLSSRQLERALRDKTESTGGSYQPFGQSAPPPTSARGVRSVKAQRGRARAVKSRSSRVRKR